MKVHAISSQEEWDAVVAAAGADNHYPHAATHWVENGGEIVGTFNIGPFVNWWMRTDQNISTSMRAGAKAQRLLKEANILQVVWMVSKDSPYLPYMERFGFQDSDIDFRYFYQIKEGKDVYRKYA